MERADPILKSETAGVFLNACVTHHQTLSDDMWQKRKIEFRGEVYSIEETFANWYFEQQGKKHSNSFIQSSLLS